MKLCITVVLLFSTYMVMADESMPPHAPNGDCSAAGLTQDDRFQNFHACLRNQPPGDACTKWCFGHLVGSDEPSLANRYIDRKALFHSCLHNPANDDLYFHHGGSCCAHIAKSDEQQLNKDYGRTMCGEGGEVTKITPIPSNQKFMVRKDHRCERVRQGDSDGYCPYVGYAETCAKAKSDYRKWKNQLVNNDACTQCGTGVSIDRNVVTDRVEDQGSCS